MTIIDFPVTHTHALTASAGHRSGRSSPLGTPVAFSIGKTNSAGTPRLERVIQYQTCDCVVPMRSASGFCPPATSQARFRASVDMPGQYPNLGEKQPKTLSLAGYLSFGNLRAMREVDKDALARRFKHRLKKLGLSGSKVARALGVSQQTVDNVVQAKVQRPRLINEMAEVLCTTANWLLWEQGPEEVHAPFSPEEVLSLAQAISKDRRALAVRYLKTLAEKDSEAA